MVPAGGAVKRLSTADYTQGMHAPSLAAFWALKDPQPAAQLPETATEPASSGEEPNLSDLEERLLPEPPAGTSGEVLELWNTAHEDAFTPQPAPWGFVVSITQNGRHRKLHHVGSCKLVPGVDCLQYVEYGDETPKAKDVDSRCKWCFKAEATTQAQVLEDSDFDDTESSSSYSGEGATKRPKLA